MFNAIFNNILVISWRPVLLVKENRSARRKPSTCRKSLTNYVYNIQYIQKLNTLTEEHLVMLENMYLIPREIFTLV